MNRIISAIILCSFCSMANISTVNAYNITVTQAEQKINEALLLEQYIIRFIIRLRDIEYRFPDIDKIYIENTLSSIELILAELDNIQKWYYTLSQSEVILKNTLQYLKILNSDLLSKIDTIQSYKQRELDNRVVLYKKTVENIYNLVKRVIEINSRYYLETTTLDQRDRKAIEIIIELRHKNEELIQYHTRKYQDINELQSYLKWIINSLRSNISELRTLRRS